MNTTDVYSPAPTKKARLEIIPLIDVVFFLLATFVLFTLSLNKITSIDVQFPKPSGDPVGEDNSVYLQATEGGAFFWKLGDRSSPELITGAELAPRLADYAKHDNPRVLIRGDDRATFGSTVFALDSVRKAGIAQYSVETRTTPTGK